MALVDTKLEPPHLQRDEADFAIVQAIAAGPDDHAVLMLNMNRYRPEAGFPDGELYRACIDGLERFLPAVGATILCRMPVLGQAVGTQAIDELLFCWYPRHRIFADLYLFPGSEENFRLKGLAVEYAGSTAALGMCHRCFRKPSRDRNRRFVWPVMREAAEWARQNGCRGAKGRSGSPTPFAMMSSRITMAPYRRPSS